MRARHWYIRPHIHTLAHAHILTYACECVRSHIRPRCHRPSQYERILFIYTQCSRHWRHTQCIPSLEVKHGVGPVHCRRAVMHEAQNHARLEVLAPPARGRIAPSHMWAVPRQPLPTFSLERRTPWRLDEAMEILIAFKRLVLSSKRRKAKMALDSMNSPLRGTSPLGLVSNTHGLD